MKIAKRWLITLGLLAGMAASSAGAQAPTITSFTPNPLQRGVALTVVGSGFGATRGVLWLGAGPITAATWTDTTITATIPMDAASGSLAVLRLAAPRAWSPSQAIIIPSPPVDDNGITVNDVKVYDNATLQQMLDTARAKLASLQFVDQTSIASHFGSLQGGSNQQSGFALNVGGPSIPGVQSTANTGGTTTNNGLTTGGQTNSGSTTTSNSSTTSSSGNSSTEQLQVTGPSTSSTTGTSNTISVTGPSLQTVTTLGQQNAPTAPTVQTSAVTLPTFTTSASNILNEQVQLNSEAAGLALLLEGALTDQTFSVTDPATGQPISIPKRRVTIGIPVSIQPKDIYKGDVAEVIVTVTAPPALVPPSITAILPQDKTYNVATINSKSIGIGGGIVTNVLSVGANWLWQKQTYYVVQDQDTVALQLPSDPDTPNRISFGWQIRPVLGRKTVSSGMRTLFVQLAIPSLATNLNLGDVTVTTHWKRLDAKTNVVRDEHIHEVPMARLLPIPDYDLKPSIEDVDDPIDNGDGTVTVHVMSHSYASGTYVKVAGNVISQGSPNLVFDNSHVDITLPAALLANNKAYLVSRAGGVSEIINPQIASDSNSRCLTLTRVQTSPESPLTGRVTATVTLNLTNPNCLLTDKNLSDLRPVAIIGNKVFGYRDAPVTIDNGLKTISFRASMDLLRSTPSITVERMFWGVPFRDSMTMSVPLIPVISTATVVKKSSDGIEVALVGSSLGQLIEPSGTTLSGNSDTGRLLTVPAAASAGLSQIVLNSTSGDLLLIAMPTDTTSSSPTLDTPSSIQSGKVATLVMKGSHLDKFLRVELNKTKLTGTKLSSDKKSIIVPIPAALVKSPAIELTFYFEDTHSIVSKIKVVDDYYEVSQPATTK